MKNFQVSKLNETLIYNYIVLWINIINKFYFSWDSLFENNINFNCPSLVDVNCKITRVPSALSTNRPVSSFTNVSMGSKNMECA